MKVVVKFMRPNGMYTTGDITQLDYDEAKKEEARNRLIILSDAPAVETINGLSGTIPPQDPANELICPICGKVCKNKLGLMAHKKSHGIV